MTDLLVHPAIAPLVGSVPVPADKSIAHRALLLAALATGTSRLRCGALGGDNLATLAVLAELGVEHEATPAGELLISGVGLHGLRAPTRDLDCGNSGTTMRLLAGVLAAQRFPSRLVGDASLTRRPMTRIATPLRLRGGRIEGQLHPERPGETTAPLELGPLPAPQVLSSLEYGLPIASAQVKGALLLSGLYADGATWLREPTVSRDHTERMLRALGVPVSSVGPMVELDGRAWSGVLPAFDLEIPGDLSAAAFLVAAALLVEGSRVDVRRAGVNPSRTGFVEFVRDMGGALEVVARGDALGEPTGELHAAFAPLRAVQMGGETLTRAIDEVPILCALAARARGVTVVRDAAELRVKESDRLCAMVRVMRAFGVRCEERPDGLVIEGVPERPLAAADIDSQGDHRVAMTAAVLGLLGSGPTRVRDADCIATSFPRFVGSLRALGAKIDVVSGVEASS